MTKDFTRVDAMGDSIDSPTASTNTLTPATVTPASPLPWHLIDLHSPKGFLVVNAERKAGSAVAEVLSRVNTDRMVQDARYVVTACNSFPALVAALKAHDAYMSEQFSEGPTSSALHPKAAENWQRVRTAIAAAEGREE